MVGAKGKRLDAFAKASTQYDDESDESDDYRVPRMLSVALSRMTRKDISDMVMNSIGMLPANEKKNSLVEENSDQIGELFSKNVNRHVGWNLSPNPLMSCLAIT